MDGEWSPQHRLMRLRSSHQRHRSLRRTALPLAVLLGALLLIASAAQAALPPKGASFKFHDHATAGTTWHVELRIDPKDPKRIKTLIAHSQQCKGTIAKTGVAISDAGVIAASGGLKNYGWWEVNAVFSDPTTLVGTMRMRRVDCDTGLLAFPNAITGDGHIDHAHGGGGHEHGRVFADFDSASLRQRRQAQVLHRRVLNKWRGASVGDVRRRGFLPDPQFKVKPGMFHVYNKRYEEDRRIFDARRPESLVFWRPTRGQPVILGPMFRVPPGKRPSFAGPIPLYHHHPSKTGRVVNRMTHVWMVSDSTTAWSNCLPVAPLEQYNPAFTWVRGLASTEGVGKPCPAPT